MILSDVLAFVTLVKRLLPGIIGRERSLAWVLKFWPVFAGAFVASLGATWLCKKVALKFGIVDRPDDLVKTHKEPIAYLGGVGMLFGLTVGVLAGIGCVRNEPLFDDILPLLLAVLAGGAIACFIGLTDDIFEISPIQKILGQVATAVILIVAGVLPNLRWIAEQLNVPLPDALEVVLQVLIVLFLVVGASNSLNLLDGLDGLCGGVTAIITVAMLILATHLATWGANDAGNPVRIILCLGLVGGVCGFLPFNRHPAKIFMGDAGSMLLGFEVAALMVLFWPDIPRWSLAAVVAFGLPILDTATALLRRLINKRPLFVSDRGHIYDQMIDRGIPLRRTVAICYLLAAFYAVYGVAMGITTRIRTKHAIFIHAAVFIISGLIIWKKGYLKMEGLRGATPKPN